jgi:hypothetical protein
MITCPVTVIGQSRLLRKVHVLLRTTQMHNENEMQIGQSPLLCIVHGFLRSTQALCVSTEMQMTVAVAYSRTLNYLTMTFTKHFL